MHDLLTLCIDTLYIIWESNRFPDLKAHDKDKCIFNEDNASSADQCMTDGENVKETCLIPITNLHLERFCMLQMRKQLSFKKHKLTMNSLLYIASVSMYLMF